MMSENDKANYHNIIREMIKREDEVRNSRNNWFMAIQGLLANAFISSVALKDLMVSLNICMVLAFIGFVTSVSFLYATWRSEMSVRMALECWNLFLIDNGKKIQDYPPITLITYGIIKNESKDNIIGAVDWENKLNNAMNLKKIDKKLNKIDGIMPFKLIPMVFMFLWFICFICGVVLLCIN